MTKQNTGTNTHDDTHIAFVLLQFCCYITAKQTNNEAD